MIETFAHKQARRLAQKLLAEAEEHEPRITADLQQIAREISSEIVGLENKFKSEESLTRKLLLLVEKDTTDMTFRQKLRKFARLNNDTLRYTFIFPTGEYTKCFREAIEKLEKTGFVIPSNRVWNAWENIGTARDTGYRGINVTVISSQNRKFEIQFHTEESFRLKTETHDLYRELRGLKTFDETRKKIIKEMLRLAKEVKRPKGI